MAEKLLSPEERRERRLKLGILMTPGVGIRSKAAIFRAMNKHSVEVTTFVEESLGVYNALNGTSLSLDDESAEFPWQDFFEFLKWLIPLLIEFIGTLPG